MAIIKRRASTRPGLFLTELIIAILFFSLASAICTQLFVKAYSVSTKSQDLSIAINQIQSVAESFKASNGSIENLSEIVGGDIAQNENGLVIFFDKDWNQVSSNPAFEISVSLNENNPITATIEATKPNKNPKESIYKVDVKKYI